MFPSYPESSPNPVSPQLVLCVGASLLAAFPRPLPAPVPTLGHTGLVESTGASSWRAGVHSWLSCLLWVASHGTDLCFCRDFGDGFTETPFPSHTCHPLKWRFCSSSFQCVCRLMQLSPVQFRACFVPKPKRCLSSPPALKPPAPGGPRLLPASRDSLILGVSRRWSPLCGLCVWLPRWA